MATVSIVVPVYGTEKFLPACLDSILAQRFADFELILVDDASPDASGRICEEYAARDARVRVLHKPKNEGPSEARNSGIEMAGSPYLTFADSDDLVEPTYLTYLLSLAEKYPRCAMAGANHRTVRGKRARPNAPVSGETVLSRRDAFEAVLYHDRVDVSAWGKLYARRLFDRIRFPKGRRSEDTFCFGELLRETEAFAYGGEPQYRYVQRAGSAVNSVFSPEKLDFVGAVRHLTDLALLEDPALAEACRRRMTHAYLSVLRYLSPCPEEYREKRDELRRLALENAASVCKNPRAPRRDKAALCLLRLGYGPFYAGWELYGRLR